MKPNPYLAIAEQHTLQPHAGRADWVAATPQAREFYVRAALENCAKARLGKAIVEEIVAAINDVYLPDDACDGLSLSRVFGIVFASVKIKSQYDRS